MSQTPNNPFGDGDFGDFANFSGFGLPPFSVGPTTGPLHYDLARQLARQLAAAGNSEANVDPQFRIKVEELSRVAELHVSQATGHSMSIGAPSPISVMTPGEWADAALTAYGPVLEALGTALTSPMLDALGEELESGEIGSDPLGASGPEGMFGSPESMAAMMRQLQPVLLGIQAGVFIGNSAREVLGQYDLPLPWGNLRAAKPVLLVGPHVASLAEEWSLPVDDLVLYLCTRELVNHSVLSRVHVAERISLLLVNYVSGFRADPDALMARFGQLDPTNMTSMEELDIDPRELLGAMATPQQAPVQDALMAILDAISGYVDHIVGQVSANINPTADRITGALARRRVTDTEATKFVRQLFGIEMTAAQYERGQAFVTGVIERAGEEQLAQLWSSERHLPTPAEIDAPGLWLARIELPD